MFKNIIVMYEKHLIGALFNLTAKLVKTSHIDLFILFLNNIVLQTIEIPLLER